jgi:voltage-gated potassium channel
MLLNTPKKKDYYEELRYKAKRPILPISILLAVLVVGTIGYRILWYDIDSTLIDALYMTVVTITTVGYAEIHPLDDVGRIFTIIISIAGIGSLFYVLSVIMENLFMYQLKNYRGKKKMLKKIQNLKDHIIVVGFGRVGRLAAEELEAQGETFVIIDENFEEDAHLRADKNMITVRGDATDDVILERAGIDKARGLIIASGSSATNVFVTLSAKVLNPDIFIVSRSDEHNDTEKLRRAGADRIVNPYSIGGQRLANLMINTNVVDFFQANLGAEGDKLNIENVRLPNSCHFFGKSLIELNLRAKTGVTVLAVVRKGKAHINPDGDLKIEKGDQLVVVGSTEQLASFSNLIKNKG